MEIGGKGLAEVDITIPQGTSLTFDIVHKDSEGNVIDHSDSTAFMAFEYKKKGSRGAVRYNLDSCCTCTSEFIRVNIQPDSTQNMPIGAMDWDIIVEDRIGERVRLCYGKANIVDTYALDEVE